MRKQCEAPDVAALRRLWRRWTAVVELFARRGRARRRLNPAEYDRLHQDLLRACRSLAGGADEGRRRPCQRMESLAEPWMTPAALEKADGLVLFDLLARGRQVEGEFDGRPWRAWRRGVSPSALLGVAAGLAVGGATAALFLVRPARGWFSDRFAVVYRAVRDAGTAQQVLAAGVVLTAIVMAVVWRAARG
jgi:hypothetical protein